MFCLQTFEVWQPLRPPAVAPKVSCSDVFDQRFPLRLIFHFSQLLGLFLAQKQHTCLQKLFLTSKKFFATNFFVERKQIKSTTAACCKLRMFGGKICHFCTQLEHVFSSRAHASMQPTVFLKKLKRVFASIEFQK